MHKLIRLFVLLLLSLLAFSLVYEAFQFVRSEITLYDIRWFLYGFGLYFLLYVVTPLNSQIRFLEVLEHELSHTTMSLAFLQVPTKLKATSTEGGKVESARGDFLTALAPYYLPLTTLPLLLIKPFVFDTLNDVLNFLIGLTLAFHYGAFSWEFRHKQDDRKDMGVIFSFIIVFIFNVVWLVIILGVVAGNYSSILVYFQRVFARTRALYTLILEGLRADEFPPPKDLIEQSDPAVESGG